jgi:hypothetical protein
MKLLDTYLNSLREIRASGEAVDETSYYVPLANFFNEVGKSLKPKVHCVLQLRNRGAGNPDGGLFTEDQLKQRKEGEKSLPQNPARGVIEIKSTADDAWVTADGEQVSRYWGKYRQILVTNYRDFVFVGQDSSGNPVKLESYRLAGSEKDFWDAADHSKKTSSLHGATFVEFAKRTMLHAAPLSAPEDLAWFLASYARDALNRIGLHDLPALASVRKALEEALGLTFEGEKGEHFFRSTLVQTLFYGVFSAWVLWAKQHPPTSKDRFDWTLTSRLLRVPVLRKLFHEVADPGQLENLNLSEILDWTSGVLNRVDRAAFFTRFQETHAVQYFYEPFLQAFDPELRKDLGVWYTPPEIVEYMVARVDTVLREELNLPDGLADKNVYVLDPCCGTGSYLVEVLKKIHETLKHRGEDALLASDLKDAAQNRVFGFEILPAPFVVAHLQIGLLLQNFGAPLAEKGTERIGVFLTNALTGWEPPKEPKKRLLFPELQEERDAAEHVKRDTPILVILGNPPYNGFAGVSPEEEEGLLEPYKRGLKEWGITKNYLDDLYVRFFRIAERRIAEKTGRGVVCYISNHSWVSDPSYVVLRKHLLESFDRFWIENMHGNRKISEYAPDGRTSETVFAISGFSPGIQQGVVISLWVKGTRAPKKARVSYREDLDSAKAAERRKKLLESLGDERFETRYQESQPSENNRFSFRPVVVSRNYDAWPQLPDLCAIDPMLGLNDNRGQAVHDISKEAISKRMQAYFDPSTPFEKLDHLHKGLTTDAASFDARGTRKRLVVESKFSSENIVHFWFKPFDLRWAYIERIANLWNRVRPDLLDQAWPANRFLLARRHAPKFPDGATLFYSRYISDQHALHTDAYFIPFYLKTNQKRLTGKNHAQFSLMTPESEEQDGIKANLSERARAYLEELGLTQLDNPDVGALIWLHSLATGFAPSYLEENADGIRQDWPRIPLPNSKGALHSSAVLGGQVAALIDIDNPVKGITAGNLRTEIKVLAALTRSGGGSLHENELAISAGWGHTGKGGITMPGKGKLVDRNYSPSERSAILEGAKAVGLTEKEVFAHLGEKTCDIYLNDVAYWSNIPEKVWEYSIGGNQIIKKWLSYREEPLLGRALTKDEVRYVQEMARRIAALLLLEPALNANYESVKQRTFLWHLKSS